MKVAFIHEVARGYSTQYPAGHSLAREYVQVGS